MRTLKRPYNCTDTTRLDRFIKKRTFSFSADFSSLYLHFTSSRAHENSVKLELELSEMEVLSKALANFNTQVTLYPHASR